MDAAQFPAECNSKIGKRFNIDDSAEAEAAAYEEIERDGLTYSFQVYAVIECSSNTINMKNGFIPFDGQGKSISRETVGLIVACIDLAFMCSFLFAIWFIMYFVRNDAERHRNLLFEA